MQIGGYFGAPLPHKIIDEEPSKVSEGPLATYERKPRTTKTIDLEPAGHSPKDGAPRVFRNLRKSGRSVRITTRTSLRGVNGSLTEKLVQRPNKTFENADIRGIGMGRDVIVAGVVE